MSDAVRTIDDYVTRYEIDYCKGDIEEAEKHAIVREVMKEKEGENDVLGRKM